MKNIQVISSNDAAEQELFAATEDEFAVFFRPGENIAFLDRVAQRAPKVLVYATLTSVLQRPVVPGPGIATHGVLFYDAGAGEGELL